jgi:outer membrane protein TolC
MKRWTKRTVTFGVSLSVLGAGCATTQPIPISPPISIQHATNATLPKWATTLAKDTLKTQNPIQQASNVELQPTVDPLKPAVAPPLPEPANARPAYSQLVTLPIDLPTVIRLVDANSPSIGFAQAQVEQAQARLTRAKVQWLPNLTAGAAYNRFDGQTQNQRGDVFSVSRGNLFAGGGATLELDIAEAIYQPLLQRRLTAAAELRAQAIGLGAELDAVTAYIDLLQAYALLEINADTLKKAEAMLAAAENAKGAKLDRTAGDVNRAKSEVLLRRSERAELNGRIGAASARLGRLLLLEPNVKLVPTDPAVVPLTLIDSSATVDDLIAQAIQNRPDLAANRELVAAALETARRQKYVPLIPKLGVTNQVGNFGGGLGNDLRNFEARNVLGVQIIWGVKNLGFGNRADVAERYALLHQAQYTVVESQARAAAEIVESAQLAAAKQESLDHAEQAVKEATELYRINKEGTFNVIDAKNLFDALRPLQAIQSLNQARQNYLSAVLDFNRAQYRLFTQIGHSSSIATQQGAPTRIQKQLTP